MAYPIDRKLVIAIASSALFDLAECDAVFREKGEEEYRRYQRDNQKRLLPQGVAFPFIKRFLRLNSIFQDQKPVEVVLLSKNDPDTGLRVFSSIKQYGLSISRAGFLSGKSPYQYIPAFNASLFLSASADDVRDAVKAGFPAGTVMRTKVTDDDNDPELRVAFDFDGVIVNDEAETVYQQSGDLDLFHQSEADKSGIPLKPGPLEGLFRKLAYFQALEHKREREDKTYKRTLRTAIITSRNAPAHERAITTLRDWGVSADETFFLGGIDKRRILEVLKPHIYFDDQLNNLKTEAAGIPSVHIPFGIANI
jgi:5'-nucleotidase